jgi:4-hydroxy-tetrahydrodipicolinate reductase
MTIAVGVNGACGRMGQRIIALASEDPTVRVAAALDSPGHPRQAHDAGTVAGVGPLGVAVGHELHLSTRLDVMIDFSQPEGTAAVLPVCVARRIPLVVATTGHSDEQREAIEEAAHDTAILVAANTSLAVNVLLKLVGEAARLLKGRGFDVEILERHHRFKKDSPSGTALAIAQAIQEAQGPMPLRHGREGLVGERPPHEIGVHSIRVGDNVGEHTVIFGAIGETLELVQRAQSRDAYARGALQAAKYLAGRPAGRYAMSDVLGL